MSPADVVAIVNPLSGAGATPGVAGRRVSLLESKFAAANVIGRVHLTERAGHAAELAREAVRSGTRLVIAWGGDGTINETGAALAGTNVALGIIPAGSGNGFASEIGVPVAPEAAIDVALRGRDRAIDAGEMEGRLFFNIAGIGFDAVVAQQFNLQSLGRRGMGPYVRIGLRECFRYRSARYRILLDREEIVTTALLIAFANGREYGNRIRLAPHARMDDGKLEAMVVEDRRPLSRLWSGRHLAFGTADKAPRIIARSIASARVETDGEMLYHLDGEIGRATGSIAVRIHPRALVVRVP
ncbi:MAG TPA: diacylglycerol kinase family protein [Vicinamibacterales bacterium]|nr:diacylglycerol kinase family protein [Vicinamibacterales bacterium]